MLPLDLRSFLPPHHLLLHLPQLAGSVVEGMLVVPRAAGGGWSQQSLTPPTQEIVIINILS